MPKKTTRSPATLSAMPLQEQSFAKRDFLVEIVKLDDGIYEFRPMGKRTEDSSSPISFVRRIDEAALRGRIDSMLHEWRKMVDFKIRKPHTKSEEYVRPFLDGWSDATADNLNRFGPDIASAGWRLFHFLFVADSPKKDEEPRFKIRRDRFVDLLLESLSTSRNTITFCSDELFIPWQMLYTGARRFPRLNLTKEDFKLERFWGISHDIEHTPMQSMQSPIISRLNSSKKLLAGIHFDKDLQLSTDCDVIHRQREYFKANKFLDCKERLYRREIIAALRENTLDDQLMYFLCHGVEDDSTIPSKGVCLNLTADDDDSDGRGISAADFDNNVEDDGLTNRPLVFCNACQGGKISSLFFESIPKVLLRKGAVALVGPLIDIPGLFADEFSRRFFKLFVKEQGKKSKPLSAAVREVTTALAKKYHNPLGLSYSVYRGVDVVIK